MIRSIFLIILSGMITTAYAQDWKPIEFKPGNIRIYKAEEGENRIIYTEVVTSINYQRPVGRDSSILQSFFEFNDGEPSYSDTNPLGLEDWSLTPGQSYLVKEKGAVYRVKQEVQDYKKVFWYLFSPPQGDTLKVYDGSDLSKPIVITHIRLFDTLVQSRQVRAFSYRQRRASQLWSTVTVVEQFGLVRVEFPGHPDPEYSLHSAYIDSTAYNWESRLIETPKICADFQKMFYRYDDGRLFDSTLFYVSPDTIDGTAYFQAAASYFHYDARGHHFRYENGEFVVYVDSDEIAYPDRMLGLGSVANGKMITDTFSVSVNGKLLPGFRAVHSSHDGGSFSVFASGLGLIESHSWSHFSGLYESKVVRASFCGDLYNIDGQPQENTDEWLYSVHSGNVRVYGNTSGTAKLLLHESNIGLDGSRHVLPNNRAFHVARFLGTSPHQEFIRKFFHISDYLKDEIVWLDEHGILRVYQKDMPGEDTLTAYLIEPPYTDTILQFDNGRLEVFNFRIRPLADLMTYGMFEYNATYKIDTTICRVTMEETKGFSRFQFPSGEEWYLSSAIINDYKLNRDPHTWDIPSLCEDNLWVYDVIGTDSVRQYFTLEPTEINGTTYYYNRNITPVHYHWLDQYPVLHHPMRTEDGVMYVNINGTEKEIEDSQVSLGERIQGIYLVTDTMTQIFNGDSARSFHAEYLTPNSASEFIWTDGIGMTYFHTQPDLGLYPKYKLVYARICGQEYGKPVSVPPVPPVANSSEIVQVSPTPVSASHGSVALHTSEEQHGTVHVAIYDALGRKVHTAAYERLGSGGVPLSVRGFTPGVYYISITGANINVTKQLVVSQ